MTGPGGGGGRSGGSWGMNTTMHDTPGTGRRQNMVKIDYIFVGCIVAYVSSQTVEECAQDVPSRLRPNLVAGVQRSTWLGVGTACPALSITPKCHPLDTLRTPGRPRSGRH